MKAPVVSPSLPAPSLPSAAVTPKLKLAIQFRARLISLSLSSLFPLLWPILPGRRGGQIRDVVREFDSAPELCPLLCAGLHDPMVRRPAHPGHSQSGRSIVS